MVALLPVLELESFLRGYQANHFCSGIQMAVALALGCLPFVINMVYNALTPNSSGGAVYVAVVVAVALEPSAGDALTKLALRLTGAGISGALGIGILRLAMVVDGSANTKLTAQKAGCAMGLIALLGLIFEVHKRRFQRQASLWALMLLTLPIVVEPSLRELDRHPIQHAAYRLLNVVIGILLSSIVAAVVFPVRARGLLRSQMARTLTGIGDFSVWIAGELTAEPDAEGRIPGATGCDSSLTYIDDGLDARLRPLHETAESLGWQVVRMAELLVPAASEWQLFKAPRRFPEAQYGVLVRSTHVAVGLLTSLLWQMRAGDVTLQRCRRYAPELGEVAVQLSTAFTALAGLVKPSTRTRKPKASSKRSRKAAAAAAAAAEAAAAQARPMPELEPAAGGGSGLEDGAGREVGLHGDGGDPLPGWDSRRPSFAGKHEDDDPFAELATHKSANVGPSIVTLTSQQLQGAQAMARLLSFSHPPSPRETLSLSPEDVALSKLKGLMASSRRLEAALAADRAGSDSRAPGVEALALVAHALTGVARQASACFSALDAERGAVLHAYVSSLRRSYGSGSGGEGAPTLKG